LKNRAGPVDHPNRYGPIRTGHSAEAFRRDVLDNLFYIQARFPAVATRHDHYMALAYAVRDRLLHRWLRSAETYLEKRSRTVAYLSAEFLIGPQLRMNLMNLDLEDEAREAMRALGMDLDRIAEEEEEPGLGTGGLGRLAACYLDSLATLQIPAIGYGIRYEFGIFDQKIGDGWQQEIADKWLRLGNPWEVARPEIAMAVNFGGHTEPWRDDQGRYRVRWHPERVVQGIAHDTAILGYRVSTANFLRLWRSEASESFDLRAFNTGDYYRAVESKVESENLSKVLYPNDEVLPGKELRLAQQYFLVSCSLQDMIRIHLQRAPTVEGFELKYAAQLNDTHPALAIAELMRLLVDEHLLGWDQAWDITRKTFAYTNHTVLYEALETWPVTLVGALLPRHLEIVYELNWRFLDQVRARFPGDAGRVRRMSLIAEDGERRLVMANLAAVGSQAVNGVSKLHTDLLASGPLRDFHALWPEKFLNVTNGISPRRFLALANPRLAKLVSARIGGGWLRDLAELRRLESGALDASFCAAWREARDANKREFAVFVAERTGVVISPAALLGVQVKRIHEYKRQHLSLLHVVALYLRLRRDPGADLVPRTFLYAGKAAPGYTMAKLIIKLIHAVGEVVNRDPVVDGRLRVVFVPDYNVTNAQRIVPAADLSEQISTAGKEASGTGNMKLALNGALTIGTLDGANIEIRDEVGPENFFLFGLAADEARAMRESDYRPRSFYEKDEDLRGALDLIASGHFSNGDRDLFRPLVQCLLERDEYLVLADFEAYLRCQEEVARAWRDRDRWTRMSIVNVARMGRFSSDRAVREYAERIWKVKPVAIEPDETAATVPGTT